MNEISFRVDKTFGSNDIVGNWILSLSWIANDLSRAFALIGQQIRELQEVHIKDDHLSHYWLAIAHFREAAKFLHATLDIEVITEFLAELPPKAREDLQAIRCTYEPWKGSLVQRIAKPVRDNLFHYPLPTDTLWPELWSDIPPMEGGIRDLEDDFATISMPYAERIRVMLIRYSVAFNDEDLFEFWDVCVRFFEFSLAANEEYLRRHSVGWRMAPARINIVPEVAEVMPGRNDPCSCGSGEKFKKCCGMPQRKDDA